MSQETQKIIIAKDFSAFPAGRTEDDGPFNGQKFRDEILLNAVNEALKNNSKVVVSLNGLGSAGSSFLEEAFGGLIRESNVKKAELIKVLDVVYSSAHLKRFHDGIFRYIKNAKPKA